MLLCCQHAPSGRLNIAMVVHLNKMGLTTIKGIWYITYSICDMNHHLKKKCAYINDLGSLKSYQRKTAQISL
jgi:hypothetical protein